MILCELFYFLFGEPQSHLYLTININNIQLKSKKMSVTLTTLQLVDGQVSGLDRKGNPESISNVTFSSSDSTIFTATQDSTDGTKVVITAISAGTGTLTFTANNANGDTLTGTATVTVTPELAVTLTLITQAPVDK